SFDIGGEGFAVRRRANALFGVNGYSARGDIAYRTSRYTTIGLAYDFTHFDFVHIFGKSDLHIIALNWAKRLSRRWELAIEAGALHAETISLQQVQLDPVIAALTGERAGIVTAHRVSWLPIYRGRLARSFEHGTFMVNYMRESNPGNGLFQTSYLE